MKRFTLTLLLVLPVSCGRTSLPCEPSTCAGCCDGGGNCRAGSAGDACGGSARAIGARTFAPDVMLVIDRSGSMLQPLDPMDAQCQGCNPSCPPACLTRGQALVTTVERFLSTVSSDARLGLVLFPSNASCAGPSFVSPSIPMSDDSSVLAMNASAAATILQSTKFSGGTPQSLALRFAASDGAFTVDPRRDHLMVLVSDGLPNCNPMNSATCMTPQTCQCTIATCTGQNCLVGCLDRLAAVDALVLAKTRDIATFVVGFGPDLTTVTGLEVFNALSVAGGRPLSCRGGLNECGPGNPCLADGTCARKFSNELNTGLTRVEQAVRRSRRCRFFLDESAALKPRLEARVNGRLVEPGDDGWQAEGGEVVRFVGSVCEQLTTNPGLNVTFTLMP
jgi:hypothetical protein